MKILSCVLAACLAGWTAWAGEVSVTNVTARQRYPWNGKVDITVTLTGASNDVANAACRFVATNSATLAALNVSHVTGDGVASGSGSTWTRKFVWDATADLGEVKIDDVALTVEAEKALGGVQLWEGGPYWAECNVGATKPEEYGYYFWWGDTVGYSANTNSATWTGGYYWNGVTWVLSTGTRMSSSPFSSSTCPTYNKTTAQLQSAGYIDSTGNLVAAHDAATAHLGAPWRMPTDAEFSALVNNCDTEWTTRNGVYGRLVTGRGAYSSRCIFLPAAGYGDESDLYYPGSYGDYWSSTPYSGNSDDAWGLYFFSGDFYRSNGYRCGGQSVRPLRGFAKFGASTTHLALDTRTGTRYAHAEESIAFSTDWNEGVTRLVLTVDGVNVLTTTTATNGVYVWKPDLSTSRIVTLKHTTTRGTVDETLTATFTIDVVKAGGSFVYVPSGSATIHPIPHDWFLATGLARVGDSTDGLDAKLAATYANGHTGWESYVAGLNPNAPASELTALVELREGEVCVSWTPDLNSNGVTRIYTVFGRTGLEKGDWETPVQPWHRFFKVAVALPTGAAGEKSAVAGEGFVPQPEPELGGVQLWENGPYWAECNVGATKPEEYGYYFWWGDTVGYTRSGGTWNGTSYNGVTWVSSAGTRMSSSPFSSSTCPTYNKSNSSLQSQGYIDSTGNLAAAHDAATAHLGAPWRMPTDAEFSALVSNCTTTWTTRNGVYGRLVTGKGSFSSKSIFLPATGYGDASYLFDPGSYGYYWSSTPKSGNSDDAWGLGFYSGYFYRYNDYRYGGQSVRPLRGFAK